MLNGTVEDEPWCAWLWIFPCLENFNIFEVVIWSSQSRKVYTVKNIPLHYTKSLVFFTLTSAYTQHNFTVCLSRWKDTKTFLETQIRIYLLLNWEQIGYHNNFSSSYGVFHVSHFRFHNFPFTYLKMKRKLFLKFSQGKDGGKVGEKVFPPVTFFSFCLCKPEDFFSNLAIFHVKYLPRMTLPVFNGSTPGVSFSSLFFAKFT